MPLQGGFLTLQKEKLPKEGRMNILKTLFWTSMLGGFFASPSFADESVVAQMKFSRMQGVKVFSTIWQANKGVGAIQTVLDLVSVNSSLSSGLKLSDAGEKAFVAPVPPRACEVNIKGVLNVLKDVTSPVVANLSGRDCDQFINDLKTTPMEMVFKNIPHQSGGGVTRELRLKLVELP